MFGSLLKSLAALGIALGSGFVALQPAHAQEYEDWDGPRGLRGAYDSRDPYYDDDPRFVPRSASPWHDEDDDEPRNLRRARPGDDLDEYDDDDARRAARPPRGAAPGGPNFDLEDDRITADGGGRPDITPLAPPRIAFGADHAPGSVIIDTSARKLYYVIGPTVAFAYPIGVGREGFAWTGKEKVSRISDWPDWYPPAEMRERKPELPEKMSGGIKNPLGAKAIYLGNTLYRIHGTNDPKSIGRAESSGCFRMINAHVLHLASLVTVGTEVTVVRSLGGPMVAATGPKRPTVSAPIRQPKWYEVDEPRGRDWR